MVVLNNFQGIFDSLPYDAVLSLPPYKENSLEISFSEDSKEFNTVYNGSAPLLPFANSEVYKARINDSRRLTAENEDCKAVYEISLDVTSSKFKFKAGDTIGVLPKNLNSEISTILSHLELESQADCQYTLTSQKGKVPGHIPVKSSLRYVLKHCVDLRCVLKKLFLLALSRHTKDENELRILEYLCSKEGSNAYQTHILNKNLTLLDIFNMFKTCKPPIQVLLANLPRLLPRPYSIVNSGLKSSSIIKICFSVTFLENNKKGLTTSWLESLISEGRRENFIIGKETKESFNLNKETKESLNLNKETKESIILDKESDLELKMENLNIRNDCDDLVPIYLRKNTANFGLPENLDKPIMMLGPGTGVAPFIGFLEEIEHYRNVNLDLKVGDIWLFFGCRNPKLDFIYEKELKGYLTRGVLTKLRTAFSRVENNGVKYIQDALKENSKEVTNLIKSGASIYICGDLKNMAVQVRDTLIQCLIENGKSREDAEEIIALMQKEKRYFVDAWS